MQHIWTIIIAIIIFGLIIGIHEFGHFIVAKLNGVQVNQFSIGMGPKLMQKKKGETLYTLRLLPVGGFCSMEGEDDKSDNPRAFDKKSIWRRMAVIVAGAAMNILLGFILIIILTASSGIVPTMTIRSFHETTENGETVSLASSQQDGLQVGDQILSLDGSHLFSTTDFAYQLQTAGKKTFSVKVKRNGETVKLDHVTFEDQETGDLIDFQLKGEKPNPINVTAYAGKDTVATAKLIWMSLIDLVTGKFGVQDMSGPVGVVSVIDEAASNGETLGERLASVASLTIFITINIGVFNMLPIPGLDGSRFLFLLLEAIRRKPVKKEHEAMVHFVGMACLFLLMILITIQDVTKIFVK